MPTFQRTPRFVHDWKNLTKDVQDSFRQVTEQFVPDLKRGKFRPQLRVKRVRSTSGVWEMTFGPDARATFEYREGGRGEAHIIWRRVGTHEIFRHP